MLRPLAVASAVAAALLLSLIVGTVAAAAPSASGEIQVIYQSPHVTEQQRFTVSVQVASTTGISFVYYNFCQLSRPVCYQPVAMALHAGNWYVGTTNPMSSYYQMVPGSHAGYNITIEYTDNHNITVPSFPNSFSNLTVATEVGSGWYMFEMTVSNLTYNLTGEVEDSATSAALSGAHVTLNNGTSAVATTGPAGTYSFGNVSNGTYRLEVSHPGYHTTNETVVVAGRDTVQNVPLANASTPVGTHSSGGTGLSGFLTNSVGGIPGWALLVVVLVVIAAVVALALSRKRRRPPTPGGPPSSEATERGTGPSQ